MSQKIRIKLKSYDHNLIDKSSEKIVKTVKSTGAVVNGPIPLPTNKRIYTVLRSPHVNKKSREQFQLSRTSASWTSIQLIQDDRRLDEAGIAQRCRREIKLIRRKNASAHWEKVGMTSIFNEEGKNIACTVIKRCPMW